MEFNNLTASIEGGTLILTINREKKLNALNLETVKELGQAFDEVAKNDKIKGVIVTGAGPKAFVAGADISEINQLTQAEAERFAKNGQDTFAKIEQCPKPVIAAVNGFALGGGCELAMACHIRVASEGAKFGLPETSLGIIPGYGGTQRLALLIGRGRALELMMTADMIDGATAERYGLANHVVPAEKLMETCQGILKKAYAKGPVAISQVIKAVNIGFDQTLGYEAEIKGFGVACNTEDFKEGTAAFLEKRKAVFKGK